MSNSPDDFELLQQYARLRSDEAFARVVGRHADFVYGVALRRVRDAHLPEDVTQATFIVLARRAGTVTSGSLRAWLHQTVCYAAANALRAKSRRQDFERHVVSDVLDGSLPTARSSESGAVKELIDDALAKLRRHDRDIIAIHYFEQQTIEQTAGRLGISYEAAKKRLARALEKLRTILRRQGVAVPAVSIGEALKVPAIHIPPVAAAAKAGANAFSIANGAIHMMRMTLIKQAALIAISIFMVIGVSAAVIDRATSRPTAPTTTPVNRVGQPLSIKLKNGVKIELVGISDAFKDNSPWWTPDGTPLAHGPYQNTMNRGAPPTGPNYLYNLYAHVSADPGVDHGDIGTNVGQMMMWGGGAPSTGEYSWALQTMMPLVKVASIEFSVAAGPWKTIRSFTATGDETGQHDFTVDAAVNISPPTTTDGFASISVTDNYLSNDARLVAFDTDGKRYDAAPVNFSTGQRGMRGTGQFRLTFGTFNNLPLARLARVEFQVRPYEYARFDDVSLVYGVLTSARVTSGKLDDQPPLDRRMYGTQQWNYSIKSVFQFIAFSSKMEVDVRWDKLFAAGMAKDVIVKATLQDPTYEQCFRQIISAVGPDKMQVRYVENKDLNVRKFVVSTPEDLADTP